MLVKNINNCPVVTVNNVIFTFFMAQELSWAFGLNKETNKKIRKHQSFKEY